MTESNFNVIQFTKAIPEFSGKPEDAQKFINLVELFYTEIPDSKKPNYFALIYNTKLPDKIKVKLDLLETSNVAHLTLLLR